MTSSFEDVSAEVTQRIRDNGNPDSDTNLIGGLGGGIGKVVADQVCILPHLHSSRSYAVNLYLITNRSTCQVELEIERLGKYSSK